METNIDKYGRVIIPKSIRERLNLLPGEHLFIEMYEDGIFLKPLSTETQVVNEEGILVLDGTLSNSIDIQRIIEKSRDERLARHLS